MLVMVVFFIAFRWIHLSTPLIRLFLLVLILLLMPTLNFLPVWFALSLLRFRLPSRLPMMFILWMVAMMVVRSEERFSRNAETDLVCRLLLEKKEGPGIVAVHLGQIVEGPVVLFGRGIAVHGLEKADSNFWCVRPVVERLPDTGLGRFGGDPLDVGLEVRIRGNRNFQVTRQIVEDPRHIRGALNVGVAAESVYAAARAPDVAEQQLQHGGGADGLCPRRMLRPAHRVNDRANLLHVTVFANGGEQVRDFQKLLLRHSGNALDHFRRVTGILLAQQLKDTPGMLEV